MEMLGNLVANGFLFSGIIALPCMFESEREK
jgi:hypothetical protein